MQPWTVTTVNYINQVQMKNPMLDKKCERVDGHVPLRMMMMAVFNSAVFVQETL